jgi:coronin-1B/1C/6
MARYVRQSSYRHVFGTPAKASLSGLKAAVPSDGNLIAGNTKYLAFPQAGGGGPVAVHPIANLGRIAKAHHVNVHKYPVMDVAWHPFIETMLITGDDAGIIKVSKLPGEFKEWPDEISEPLVTLEGHAKKVGILQPHPVANNILISTSYDQTVRVWDIEAQSEVLKYDLSNEGAENITPMHVEWNRNGSLVCVATREGKFKIYDPRDSKAVQTGTGFSAQKKSTICFADNHGLLVGAGSSKSATREVKAWDPRNLGEVLSTVEVDSSNGVFITQYDPDNSIFWLAGKGDSTIKYFEVVKEKPCLHLLSQFQDSNSTVGGCFLPKRYCDVTKCEIAVFLRVLKESICPVSFQVPRKSDLFQKDLYPDAYAGIPALEAKEWLEGKNADPKLQSMKPGAAVEKVEAGFSAGPKKKSVAELEAEVERLTARVKELEAQLAAK